MTRDRRLSDLSADLIPLRPTRRVIHQMFIEGGHLRLDSRWEELGNIELNVALERHSVLDWAL